MLCLQSSHLGHDGARLYHLDPRWIQEGSKHNHTFRLKSVLAIELICCAEVTRKKASPKQALYCQSTDSVSFFIFKKTDICSLVQILLENNSPFLFHVAFFCASLQPARQPPLVPPWEASQQENKSLGPPEGIRGSGYALGEPPHARTFQSWWAK